MNQKCAYNANCIGASITGVSYDQNSYGTRNGNEAWLLNTVGNVGPTSVAIYASQNFVAYSSGFFLI